MNLLPLLAQAATETTVEQKGFWSLIWGSDPLVKLTLLILIGFSVVCWAIIIMKIKQLRKAQVDSQEFWNQFNQAKTLQELALGKVRSGPLYEVYALASQLAPQYKKRGDAGWQLLENKINQSREEEIYQLEEYVPLLATTASVTPFIGLFGTVWGILSAFFTIGKMGSSSLATVGPFISEALIATAVGLAAAIPALIAYNYFVARIRVITKMMDLFIADLAARIREE